MTTYCSHRLLVLCGLVFANCTVAWAGPPVASVELKDVLRAWEARTKESRTVRYEWNDARTEATASLGPGSFFGPAFAPRQSFDTDFVTHTIHHSLQFAAGAAWHQRSGAEWAVDNSQFHQTTSWHYFENPVNISLYVDPESTKLIPEIAPAIAFVDKRGHNEEWEFSAGPIAMHHRALDDSLSPVKTNALKLMSDRETIKQHACVRLADGACSYWVDAENAFLIRRCEHHLRAGSDPDFRINTDYKKDAGGEWVVADWTCESTYDTGKLRVTDVATVTVADLNGKVEPNEKLVEIPVGAVVNDDQGKERSTYILLAAGEKRRITHDDQYGVATYQGLLNSKPGHAIPNEFIELHERIRAIPGMTADERTRALSDLKRYLAGHKTLVRDVALVNDTADRLFRAKEPEAAIKMCREFAGISDILGRALFIKARELEGDLRRERLLGSEMVIDGNTVEGKPFDWARYRGKIVLVDFWYTGCGPCVEEMPRIKQMYRRYHESGFDVVGISGDPSDEELKQYLMKNEIPWTTIHAPAGAEDANVVRYNIIAFPTCFLVDRSGKVLSLDTHGDELEALIKQSLDKK